MAGTSQGYMELLASAQVAGTNLASFTTAASILPAHAKHTIPADEWSIGKQLFIRAAGRISNVVTAAPTFTFSVNFGATSVWSGGAMQTSTTAHTTLPWYLEIMLTCRAIGGSANLMGQGWCISRVFQVGTAGADNATLMTPLILPATTPAVGSNFDSGVAQVVDLLAACSTSNASNAIQLEQYGLFEPNFG